MIFSLFMRISYYTDLKDVLERDIENLSGGELQRFAISIVAVQNADMYD